MYRAKYVSITVMYFGLIHYNAGTDIVIGVKTSVRNRDTEYCIRVFMCSTVVYA